MIFPQANPRTGFSMTSFSGNSSGSLSDWFEPPTDLEVGVVGDALDGEILGIGSVIIVVGVIFSETYH